MLGEMVVFERKDESVKLRVAPFSDLATAPDHQLLSDAQSAGKKVSHLSLYARGEYAVHVIEAARGTFAFRIDSAGNVIPVAVRSEIN
jgi:hypothetical protein